MIIPPQALLPTRLCVDPESQKGTTEECQPPRNSAEERPIVRYAHGYKSTALHRLEGEQAHAKVIASRRASDLEISTG